MDERRKKNFLFFLENIGWAIKNDGLPISRLSPPNFIRSISFFLTNRRSIRLLSFAKIKSKDFQKLVLSKYENGDGPTKIFRDLNGAISLPAIERWCKSIRDTSSINLSWSSGRPRTIRTKAAIRKIKKRRERGKSVPSRKLARDLSISRTSVRRILKDDLGL